MTTDTLEGCEDGNKRDIWWQGFGNKVMMVTCKLSWGKPYGCKHCCW